MPRISGWDAIFVVLPLLFWAWVVKSRGGFIHLRCATDAAACRPSSLFFADQYALGQESRSADLASFVTQDLSGSLALLGPWIWALIRVPLKMKSRQSGGLARPIGDAWADTLILLETCAWNGLVTESLRLLVQRPRPFVYLDPKAHGADAANYTSFVSGHTSFAAASSLGLFFCLMSRGASNRILALAGIAGTSLTILTGVFRVLAGRHFLTDVLAAACTGTACALAVALAHRPRA